MLFERDDVSATKIINRFDFVYKLYSLVCRVRINAQLVLQTSIKRVRESERGETENRRTNERTDGWMDGSIDARRHSNVRHVESKARFPFEFRTGIRSRLITRKRRRRRGGARCGLIIGGAGFVVIVVGHRARSTYRGTEAERSAWATCVVWITTLADYPIIVAERRQSER